MHFILLGQRNSLGSWENKLHSHVNMPTGTVAIDLNVSRPIIFKLTADS